ncbi:tissue factor pathway inhibitor-like [Spodoptera litura]|uniref:Tissue factor pathway inhibitor-like n=1 Tax=Spodoptera litura TaxID=69820 RepID=A0A9J7J0K5_SPOLT|nr:tissue factor pathway inhibitor-like [Spodoptera litura]
MFLGSIIHSLFTVISFTVIQLRADETTTKLTTELTADTTAKLTTKATKLTTKATDLTTEATELAGEATKRTTETPEKVNEETTETFQTTQTKVSPSRAHMDDLTTFDDKVYCKFQANSYSCSNARLKRKYYYDIQLNQCIQFDYGHCKHSYNMFDGRRDCFEACEDEYSHQVVNVTANVYCRFQPDFGDCHMYNPMWYFDIIDMRCKGFSYSGCGGNDNRFRNVEKCLSVCSHAVKHTEED